MCGDFLFGTLMCCCLPCISKRDGNQITAQHQAEAPRPVKPQYKGHKPNSTAVDKPSPPRVSARKAHQKLIASLSQPANGKQTAALFRLRMAFSMTKEHLSPEFFATAISDLDKVLFNSSLRDKVLVDWAELPDTSRHVLHGVTSPYGISIHGISRVRIRYNKAILETDTKKEIRGTIVHEMLHAYLLLTSKWGFMTMRHHGPRFEESCRALVRRLGLDGFEVRHIL